MTRSLAAVSLLALFACGEEAEPRFSGAEPPRPAAPITVATEAQTPPVAAPSLTPPAPVAPPVAPTPAPTAEIVSPTLRDALLTAADVDETHEIPTIERAPIGATDSVIAAVLANADEPLCSGPYPVDVLLAVVREDPVAHSVTLRSFAQVGLTGDETSIDQACDVTLALELRDFDGDGADEVSLVRSASGQGWYSEVSESTLFVFELAPAIERIFEAELSRSVDLQTPGCYEGDDPEGDFSVMRNDRATIAWSSGLASALDLTITREDFARACIHEMSPIHRRGVDGTCIQETTYGYSSVHRTWLPYRGLAATGFLVIGATGEHEALERRRAEIAAGYDGFAPGYPALVRTDDIAGLRPGLDILVLARCPSRADANASKRGLPAALSRHAELRGVADVTALPVACPTAITPRP